MRVGVVNRFDDDKRERYPFGPALRRLGATYVPIDVRDLRAYVGNEGPHLTVETRSGGPGVLFDDLGVDGVLWRVSENTFNDYHSVIEPISRHHPVINSLPCLLMCSDLTRAT